MTALFAALTLVREGNGLPVRFVSPDKSPFTDKRVVLPADESGKPEIIIFREPDVSDGLYKSLRDYLKETKIVSVIRKVGSSEFRTVPQFDLAKYRKNQDAFQHISQPGEPVRTEPTTDWFDAMKVGEATILFDQGLIGERKPIEWGPTIAGIIVDNRIAVSLAETTPNL